MDAGTFFPFFNHCFLFLFFKLLGAFYFFLALQAMRCPQSKANCIFAPFFFPLSVLTFIVLVYIWYSASIIF